MRAHTGRSKHNITKHNNIARSDTYYTVRVSYEAHDTTRRGRRRARSTVVWLSSARLGSAWCRAGTGLVQGAFCHFCAQQECNRGGAPRSVGLRGGGGAGRGPAMLRSKKRRRRGRGRVGGAGRGGAGERLGGGASVLADPRARGRALGCRCRDCNSAKMHRGGRQKRDAGTAAFG